MNWLKQYHNELYGLVCLAQTFPNLHHENFSPCVCLIEVGFPHSTKTT